MILSSTKFETQGTNQSEQGTITTRFKHSLNLIKFLNKLFNWNRNVSPTRYPHPQNQGSGMSLCRIERNPSFSPPLPLQDIPTEKEVARVNLEEGSRTLFLVTIGKRRGGRGRVGFYGRGGLARRPIRGS